MKVGALEVVMLCVGGAVLYSRSWTHERQREAVQRAKEEAAAFRARFPF